MALEANKRSAIDHDRLAAEAWSFSQVGDLAGRSRLFAGFVTSSVPLDGYGADYLTDFAIQSGITAYDIPAAMSVSRLGEPV